MFAFNNFIETIKATVSSTICINAHRLMPVELIEEMNTEEVRTTENTDHVVINITPENLFNGTDAIIYVRVSTTEQDIDAQKFSCEQYCIQNKLNIKKIYIEKCSAFKNNSQQKLHKLIKENQNCNLIIFSIDRLSRNIKIGNELIKSIENKNITLISVKENINLNTALGKHNFRNYINAAQYESELISERVKNSIQYRKANNIHIGQAPYGYKLENGKLIKNFEESAVINFITRNYGKYRSSDALTLDLYHILTIMGRDESEFVPISFTLEDDEFEYQSYNVNEKLKITSRMLSNILNDYNIKKRGTIWNISKIARIYKNVTIFEFKNMNIGRIQKVANFKSKPRF